MVKLAHENVCLSDTAFINMETHRAVVKPTFFVEFTLPVDSGTEQSHTNDLNSSA